jgi:uroporphyrinogen decarboxylase
MERFLVAANMGEPDEVPVVLLASSRFFAGVFGIKVFEFYHDPRKMLNATIKAMRLFPDVLFFPGLWADYGIVVEASAFGSRVSWREDYTPYIKGAVLRRPEDIEALETPDPLHDGLMPFALESIEYMQREAPKEFKYLFSVSRGPTQLASFLRGTSDFLLDLRIHPDLARKLIEVCTETTITWLREQLKVINEPLGIFVPDDNAAFLSPKLFRQFVLPYYKRIFGEFKGLLRAYHNDANTSHLLETLAESGFQVFNFSFQVDAADAKRRIGDKVCLMGNIHPIDTLLKGTPEAVKKACRKCIEVAGPGGGYVLSAGGGIDIGTPAENIEAMVDAARKYGKYPIKRGR